MMAIGVMGGTTSIDELFDALDLGADGALSRDEITRAAPQLGWHWARAPLYAVLDRLTVQGPLSRVRFRQCIEQILDDSDGPYGQVLRRAPAPTSSNHEQGRSNSPGSVDAVLTTADGHSGGDQSNPVEILERLVGPQSADAYGELLKRLEASMEAPTTEVALLIIDPQCSFTGGAWMRSIGPGGDVEVEPIRSAFDRCAALLRAIDHARWPGPTMFTRCPFPPDSYGWDRRLAGLLPPSQAYFIKPGNSVMWPKTNGFDTWVEGLLERGTTVLVMGGCTLNSCVRVSSAHAQVAFGPRGLQVVVDLALCGSRARNYVPAPEFGDRSAVTAAVEEMIEAGVRVVARTKWAQTG